MKIRTANKIKFIITGGQSGVDRAALDFSIKYSIPHKGYCPAGRCAEDGRIDARYNLTETESSDPAVRTKKNIELADATLIIFAQKMDEGTILTESLAHKLQKPFHKIDLYSFSTKELLIWIEKDQIRTLNIAGPRESNSPGIYKLSLNFLESIKDLF